MIKMAIKNEIKSGLFIRFISRYCGVVVQVITMGILARLLSPKEFGVIAVVTVFIRFFELLSHMGLGSAIIQNNDLNDKDHSAIFSFTIIAGIFFAFCFYNFSYVIAKFYLNEEYIKICKYLSISVLFSSFNIVPKSLMRKKFKLKKMGIIEVSADIISGLVAIYLAYNKISYYALIWKSNLRLIILFTFQYIFSELKFKYILNLKPILKIAKFSVWQFLSDFTSFFSINLGNILIGKYIGLVNLGYYDKAYTLMSYPTYNLLYVISPVLHPVLAKYQDEYKTIYNSYLKIIRISTLIGMPLSVYLYFTAEELIKIVFGQQWIQSVPIFKILALSIWVQISLSCSDSIFKVTGRTDYLFLKTFLSNIFMALGIFFGIQHKSLNIIAYGMLFSFFISFFINYWIIFKIIFKSRLKLFFNELKSSIIITIIIFALLSIISSHLYLKNIYFLFLIKSLITFIGFIVALFFTKESKFIFNIFFKDNILLLKK